MSSDPLGQAVPNCGLAPHVQAALAKAIQAKPTVSDRLDLIQLNPRDNKSRLKSPSRSNSPKRARGKDKEPERDRDRDKDRSKSPQKHAEQLKEIFKKEGAKLDHLEGKQVTIDDLMYGQKYRPAWFSFEILKKAGFNKALKCAVCPETHDLQKDHVIPWKAYVAAHILPEDPEISEAELKVLCNDPTNLQFLCKKHNVKKSDFIPERPKEVGTGGEQRAQDLNLKKIPEDVEKHG